MILSPLVLTSAVSFFFANKSLNLDAYLSVVISTALSPSTSNTRCSPPWRSRPSTIPLLGMFSIHQLGIYLKAGVLGRKKTTARIRNTLIRITFQRTFFFIKPPLQSPSEGGLSAAIYALPNFTFTFSAIFNVTVFVPTASIIP